MKKNEFLVILGDELRKKGIADVDDILSEYEEHFAVKIADGYSEEQIAHKLGKPSELALQFEKDSIGETSGSRKILAYIGFFFANLFAGASFILLWIWEVVMVGLTLVFGVLGIALLFNLQIQPIIPPIPYWCGAIFGLSFLALSLLLAIGSIYFAVYLRQLMRSFARFNHNTLASARGRAVLPPVPTNPQLSPRHRRRLRSIALFSLAAFAICFVLSIIASILSAQALEFWHQWQWFGYGS